MIKLTINGKAIEIEEGATIMEAAAGAGIKIPSLCHLKGVHTYGSCRICVGGRGNEKSPGFLYR